MFRSTNWESSCNSRPSREGMCRSWARPVTDRSGYLVTGNVNAPDISFKQGNSRVTGVQMTSSFLVDPKTIAANDLRLRAFGGELAANARVENLAAFTLQARLRDFQIHNLSAALVSKPAAYAGSI